MRPTHAKALLLAALVGAFVYMFMPSCAFMADADDTLCYAIAAAEGQLVDWPVAERWHNDPSGGCHVFDQVLANPWCEDQEAREYMRGFGISKGEHWGDFESGDGTSYDDSTSEVDTPLGRTYSGYANFVYANREGTMLDRNRSLKDFDYYDTFLKWASAFVTQKTYRVNGNCGRNCQTVGSSSCAIAKTVRGPFRNDYIDLYQTFYYDIDSVWRASTVFHEVRHARDQVAHHGGSGCSRGSACDKRWSTAGANTYEMMWLAAYYWTPEDHPFITPARRDRARALFDTLRSGAFDDPVQWTLADMEPINEIPDFYVQAAACSEDPQNPHGCLILAN
jgi:hypothetical protein